MTNIGQYMGIYDNLWIFHIPWLDAVISCGFQCV